MAPQWNSSKHLRRKYKLFQGLEREREREGERERGRERERERERERALLSLFYEVSMTLIPKLNKNIA